MATLGVQHTSPMIVADYREPTILMIADWHNMAKHPGWAFPIVRWRFTTNYLMIIWLSFNASHSTVYAKHNTMLTYLQRIPEATSCPNVPRTCNHWCVGTVVDTAAESTKKFTHILHGCTHINIFMKSYENVHDCACMKMHAHTHKHTI